MAILKPLNCRWGLVALFVVFAAHLALSLPGGVKRIYWLLHRYSGCHSSVACWQDRALEYAAVTRLVNDTTPTNATIRVRGTRTLVREIGFYCFPRPVIWEKEAAPPGAASIDPLGDNSWRVTAATPAVKSPSKAKLLDLNFFVPARAYLLQLGLFGFGVAVLLLCMPELPILLLLACAYPMAALLTGLMQWLFFFAGHARWALPCLGGLGLAAIALAFATGRWRALTKFDPGIFRYRSTLVLLLLIVAGGAVGYLINQSTAFEEDDPRWQWAYRAKIVATFDGYENAFYQQNDLYHENPRYPLVQSSLWAVVFRCLGGTAEGAALRSVWLAYFMSFFLLVIHYARRSQNAVGACIGLIALFAIPKFWSFGLDENYLDFPLGMFCALTFFVVAEEQPVRAKWPLLVVLGAGITGFKNEGVILLGTVLLGCVALQVWKGRGWVAGCRPLLPVIVGAVVGIALSITGARHVASGLAMENVEFSALSFDKFVQNVNRLPLIASTFLHNLTDLRKIGLLVPIVGLALFRGTALSFSAMAIWAGYLLVMMVPFIFSGLDLGYHLGTTVMRFIFQVVPFAFFVVAEGFRWPREEPAA